MIRLNELYDVVILTNQEKLPMDVLKQIGNEGLIPVAVVDSANDAVRLSKALLDGGLGLIEVTMRTAAGIDAIRSIRKTYPEMLVGAGTVLTLDKAKEAVETGAQFIVTPGFDEEIVAWCLENDMPVTPGCVTPTEICRAIAAGLSVLKFFPANVYGGLEGMKALSGPFGMISFIPTGGISGANLADYADKPFIHAIGGGFLANPADVRNGKFDSVTKTAADAIGQLLGFELTHVGINCSETPESDRLCKVIGSAFGFDYRPGDISNFAGSGVELVKGTGPGDMGHIAISTNNLGRAVYHLKKRGFEVDHDTQAEKNGKPVIVFLSDRFGGFAVHLLQKQVK